MPHRFVHVCKYVAVNCNIYKNRLVQLNCLFNCWLKVLCLFNTESFCTAAFCISNIVRVHEAPDPAPTVNLLKCGDSSLDFTVRVWVNGSDYWPVYFRMLDHGKRALDKAGINIPYPQMDVHMK